MSITIPAIETDIGHLCTAGVAEAKKLSGAITKVASAVVSDVNKIAPFVESVTSEVAPQYVAAEKFTVALINWFGTEVAKINTDVQGGNATPLPDDLVSAFKGMQSQLIEWQKTL